VIVPVEVSVNVTASGACRGRRGGEAGHRHECALAGDEVGGVAAVAGEDEIVAERARRDRNETDVDRAGLARRDVVRTPLLTANGLDTATLPVRARPPVLITENGCVLVWPMISVPKLRLVGVTTNWAGCSSPRCSSCARSCSRPRGHSRSM